MKFGLSNIKFVVLLTLLLGLAQFGFAQVPNLGQTSRLMNAAKSAMQQSDYELANHHFRQIIDSKVPIPSEMPFLFAETLFHLGQYHNSQSFLQKYLEINGFKGDHYHEAKQLEEQLKEPLATIQSCQFCDRKGYRYNACPTCEGRKQIEQDCSYCKGHGIVGCSRCAGKGMITKKNVFNIVEYFECQRCDGKGRLTCPQCEGSNKEFSQCKTCKGTGALPSDELCDHEEHDHNTGQGIAQSQPRLFGNLFNGHSH
jgi:hypothetical protein